MSGAEPEDHPAGQRGGSPPRPGGPLALVLPTVLGALNAIGTIWIFVLMLVINADVVGRGFFNSPVPGVNEIIELSIVGIVFLQLGDAARSGRLTRSEGLFTVLLKRRPRFGRIVGMAFDLLGALFMAIIIYGSWPLLVDAYTDNEYVGTIGVFAAPVWPIQLVIVIGCTVTFLQFLAFAWRYLIAHDLLDVEAHSQAKPE